MDVWSSRPIRRNAKLRLATTGAEMANGATCSHCGFLVSSPTKADTDVLSAYGEDLVSAQSQDTDADSLKPAGTQESWPKEETKSVPFANSSPLLRIPPKISVMHYILVELPNIRFTFAFLS
jgi:hypothetical protein